MTKITEKQSPFLTSREKVYLCKHYIPNINVLILELKILNFLCKTGACH